MTAAKSMRRAIVLAAFVVAGVPTAGQAGPPFYLRLGGGIASPALKEWNDDIQNAEDAYRSSGAAIDIETMGVGFPVMGEVGVRIGGKLGLGVLGSWQSRQGDQTASGPNGSLSWDRRVASSMIAGAIDYVIAAGGEEGWTGMLQIDRFTVGGDVGWAWADARFETHFAYYPDPTADRDIRGDWTGDALTASAWIGFDRMLSPATALFARFGYRHQGFGELEGGYTSPQLGELPGPPRSGVLAGGPLEPLDTDLSGVYVLAGFSFGR